jgi:hypothetical protein
MVRYMEKQAVLAKIETVYGTDVVPTGAANAIQMTSAKYKVEAEEVSRDLLKPYMGHQGVILVGKYATLSGDVEIAGAGAAGTVPGYGVLLRMAGFAETITALTDVQYKPVSGAFDSGSVYFNLDGVGHVLLGARATVKFGFKPKEIPRWTFDITGLLGTIADVALPTGVYTAFKDPLPVNKANTTFSLHGYAGGTEGVSIDTGGKVEPRLLINTESIQYVDREATGEAIMEAAALATINWFNIAQAHTTGVLALQHGLTAGNIVKIDAPAVQLGMPDYGETQKIVNQTLKLMLKPSVGNDEVTITIK